MLAENTRASNLRNLKVASHYVSKQLEKHASKQIENYLLGPTTPQILQDGDVAIEVHELAERLRLGLDGARQLLLSL